MKFINSLFFGVIAALGALVIQIVAIALFADPNAQLTDLVDHLSTILVFAAFIEELVKFLVIYKTSPQSSRPREILIHALLVGFGFSLMESFLKPWHEILPQFYLYIGLLGLFMTHLSTSTLFAWSTVKMKSWNKFSTAGLALAPAFGMHLLYNSLWIYDAPHVEIYVCLILEAMLILSIIYHLARQKAGTADKFAK